MANEKPIPKNISSPKGAAPPKKPAKPVKTGGGFFAALRQYLTLASLAAILAFAGAIAGSVLSNSAQRALWEEEFAYSSEQRIVDKRIDLIERTIMLMSESYAIQETEKDNIKAALSTVAKVAVDPTSIVGAIKKNFREQNVAKCKAIASRTEYTNVLKLNRVFFGAKTRRVVDKLLKVDPWWDAKATDRQALIDAMYAEFVEGYEAG